MDLPDNSHNSHCNISSESDFDVLSLSESISKYSMMSENTVILREKRKLGSFKYRSNKSNNNRASIASEISEPIDVQRQIHVYHNSETGALEGLPLSWIRAINSEDETEQPIKCLYEVYPIDNSFHERMRHKHQAIKNSTLSGFQKLKRWFKKSPESQRLSFPTEFHHTIHVTRNPETGELEGLPREWLPALAN